MGIELAYLSLGSNLGDRLNNLKRAIALLEEEEVRVTARSSVYETEPQDVTDQPWFLNAVIACETTHAPLQLLAFLNAVERRLGRAREGAIPRGPRLIDIDILLFGDLQVESGELIIPHPRMLARRFVLEPLLEIKPDLKYPATNKRLQTELQNLTGQTLRKLQNDAWVRPLPFP